MYTPNSASVAAAAFITASIAELTASVDQQIYSSIGKGMTHISYNLRHITGSNTAYNSRYYTEYLVNEVVKLYRDSGWTVQVNRKPNCVTSLVFSSALATSLFESEINTNPCIISGTCAI